MLIIYTSCLLLDFFFIIYRLFYTITTFNGVVKQFRLSDHRSTKQLKIDALVKKIHQTQTQTRGQSHLTCQPVHCEDFHANFSPHESTEPVRMTVSHVWKSSLEMEFPLHFISTLNENRETSGKYRC